MSRPNARRSSTSRPRSTRWKLAALGGVIALASAALVAVPVAAAPTAAPFEVIASYDVPGSYVQAGVDLTGDGAASAMVVGVPERARVVGAHLIWTAAGTSPVDGAGTVAGTAVTGRVAGTGPADCSGNGSGTAYTADVSDLVQGNGLVDLSGFSATQIGGARLVVVYAVESAPAYPMARVLVYGGYAAVADATSATLDWGFAASNPVGDIRTTSLGATAGNEPADGRSIGASVAPGATSVDVSAGGRGCRIWTGQVLSVGVDGAKDTDGDALLDGWEANGYDADGDGKVDVKLPKYGADKLHKDVFVEMDYMGAEKVCPCHLPLDEDLDRIVDVFAKSPKAKNPDGKKGIAIHLDAGKARAKRFNLGGGNLVPHDDDLNPYTSETLAIKADHFDPDRAKIFHYMIWAHGYGGGSSSGVSFGIPADTFIVTLGLWPEHGSSNAKVGTFIHELGHGLGIRHGGGTDQNYKPNFLSVMSYAFQIDGVPRVGKDLGYFGYSKALLPPLTETTLDEEAGLDGKSAKKFQTKWWCLGSLHQNPGRSDRNIDWDCDGSVEKQDVNVDVNNDGVRNTLVGHQDWGNLVYDGGAIGEGASAPGPVNADELTYEDYLRHRR